MERAERFKLYETRFKALLAGSCFLSLDLSKVIRELKFWYLPVVGLNVKLTVEASESLTGISPFQDSIPNTVFTILITCSPGSFPEMCKLHTKARSTRFYFYLSSYDGFVYKPGMKIKISWHLSQHSLP